MARGRSVPARASPRESPPRSDHGYDNSKALIAAMIPSPSISPNPPTGSIVSARPNSKLLRSADALARMTIELNMHAMATQTARLEQALGTLMMRRKEDKEYLEKNEARIQSMVQEIQMAKQRMEELQSAEWNGRSSNDLEQCKRDMHEIIGELKKDMEREMSDLKGRVGDLSSTLDKLPTVAEAEALISRTRVTRSALRKSGKAKAKPDDGKLPVPRKFGHFLLYFSYTVSKLTIVLKRRSKDHQAAYRRRHQLNPSLELRPQKHNPQRRCFHCKLPQAAV